MVYTCHYESQLGGILLAADEIGLTGLWFDGQKYFARELPAERTEKEMPILTETKRWAVQSGTIRFRFSFPATGWWEQTEASPDMPAEFRKR